jgi:ABC-type transport system involved in multi-copper enzyme maturation permease subunit
MSTTIVPEETLGRPSAASAPSLFRLAQVELRKSYDTRAGRWLLLLIGVAAFAVVGLELLGKDTPKTFGDYFAFTQLPVGILLPVLGVLLVTSEWSQRTAMTTFALVPRRSRVLTAKVLAASFLAVLSVAASTVPAAVGTALTPVFSNSGLDWGISVAEVTQLVLLEVIYVLAGVALGVLLLNSPLAIVVYFVLPTAFMFLVNTVATLDWVRDWLDLSSTTLPMYRGDLHGQGWLQLATSAAVWIVVPMALGWWRIRRTEIA